MAWLPFNADARDGALGNFPLTEFGTAGRLIAKHGTDLRYVPEAGKWLVWRADHWAWDDDGSTVRCLTAQLHKDIYGEGCGAGHDSAHFLRWARQVQSKSTVKQVVAFASDDPTIRIPLVTVDQQPTLVGLKGAGSVLDLSTGKVRAASRDDLVTRSLNVSRLGAAHKAVRWKRFLDEVFNGDGTLIDWMHRYMGYALSGLTSEHLFLFAWGGGANGKSVFVSLCQHIWSGYACAIQPETLMSQTRSGAGPTPDLARLAGARLVVGSETEEGRPLAEALIKQLTGGDQVAARELYGQLFEFRPMMKLMLAGNHRPTIKGTDSGIWRRMRLLPFNRAFSPGERDPKLLKTLIGEADDIVAWLADGYGEFTRRGLSDVPSAMAAATEAYRTEEDIIGRWISERTNADGICLLAGLYADYRGWCESSGQPPKSGKAFSQQLRERGLGSSHTRNGNTFSGISLRHMMM